MSEHISKKGVSEEIENMIKSDSGTRIATLHGSSKYKDPILVIGYRVFVNTIQKFFNIEDIEFIRFHSIKMPSICFKKFKQKLIDFGLDFIFSNLLDLLVLYRNSVNSDKFIEFVESFLPPGAITCDTRAHNIFVHFLLMAHAYEYLLDAKLITDKNQMMIQTDRIIYRGSYGRLSNIILALPSSNPGIGYLLEVFFNDEGDPETFIHSFKKLRRDQIDQYDNIFQAYLIAWKKKILEIISSIYAYILYEDEDAGEATSEDASKAISEDASKAISDDASHK